MSDPIRKEPAAGNELSEPAFIPDPSTSPLGAGGKEQDATVDDRDWNPSPKVVKLCRELRQRWREGDCTPVEELIRDEPSLQNDDEAALDLIMMNGGNRSGIAIGAIDSFGRVHPDQFTQHHILGSIREKPFSQIWSRSRSMWASSR